MDQQDLLQGLADMKWTKVFLEDLKSDKFRLASDAVRSNWLRCIEYCLEKETMGVIKNAQNWGDREWLMQIGMTKCNADELLSGAFLELHSDSNGYIVKHYPVEDEQGFHKAKVDGKAGAEARKAKKQATLEGTLEAPLEGTLQQIRDPRSEIRDRKNTRSYKHISYSADFERWWSEYPRPEEKARAYKVWCSLPLPAVEVMIDKLKAQKATEWAGREKKHIFKPANYLSYGSWENEISDPNAKVELKPEDKLAAFKAQQQADLKAHIERKKAEAERLRQRAIQDEIDAQREFNRQ